MGGTNSALRVDWGMLESGEGSRESAGREASEGTSSTGRAKQGCQEGFWPWHGGMGEQEELVPHRADTALSPEPQQGWDRGSP